MSMEQTNARHSEPVAAAQHQLGLILSFFPRVDALLAVLLSLNVAMLGVAFARAPEATNLAPFQSMASLIYLALAGMSFLNLYRGSFPNTDGGIGSLVYFAEIAKLDPVNYVERFSAQSDADLSHAILHQAWRNACILTKKFASLKLAYRWLLISVCPWAAALMLFSPGKGA